ncbi:hypothetical protein TIFTF001_029394 [Ficus carica]|uniref:Uncharacterized protein n=1 Tax=Ficus carica TaxID=3494 RepID=A0AA88DRP9_FICCA|nr:hypothetical protein TIFTF001_029394 [Ficus carica]
MTRTSSFYHFSTLKPLQQPNILFQGHSILAGQIKRCSKVTELEHVYASMIKTGATQDAFLTNQVISACSSHSRVDYAVLAFNQMETPNVFVYNAMIRSYVHCNYPNQALGCYVDMMRANVSPSSYTIKESRKVCDEMPERDAFAWTTIISAHARAGDVGSAALLFERVGERNTTIWNTMIDGYARLGNLESAKLLFNQMPTRDIISWTTMIACYSHNKKYREALAVFKKMMMNGISPDGVTMAIVISACAHLGALELGKEMHLYVMQNGFHLDVFIGSALIDMYAKCGELDRSLLVFFKLREKNLFCWNSIIEGLAAHGYAKEALAMFSKMEEKNIKPNGVTFISVLSACTHAGLVKEGRKRFLSMANDYSITPGVEHYGCMVDLLSKAGLLEEALDLIRSMKVIPNAAVWGALLGGCKLHRNLTIAQEAVIELMVLEPNNSGYYHLLANMFSEVNQWGEVKKIWATMKELGVEKRCPGASWIEMERSIHQFTASDNSHPACAEIYSLLAQLNGQLKLAGYVPEVGSG